MHLVQAFGRGTYEKERFESDSAEALKESVRTARLEAAAARAADLTVAVDRLLRLGLGDDAADRLALLELRQLAALGLALLVLAGPVDVALEPVDAAPAGLERDLAARAEALALDSVTIVVRGEARRRVEDGEEAARDEVEDAPLVGREAVDVVVDVRRDDRVVVVDRASLTTRPSGSWSSAEHEARRARRTRRSARASRRSA